MSKDVRKLTLRKMSVQRCCKLVFGGHANKSINDFTALEQHARWDGANTVSASGLRILIGIHLADAHPAIIVGCQFFNDRCQHFAGTAPRRPKIDEDRLIGLENFSLKVVVRKIHDILSHNGTSPLLTAIATIRVNEPAAEDCRTADPGDLFGNGGIIGKRPILSTWGKPAYGVANQRLDVGGSRRITLVGPDSLLFAHSTGDSLDTAANWRKNDGGNSRVV